MFTDSGSVQIEVDEQDAIERDRERLGSERLSLHYKESLL